MEPITLGFLVFAGYPLLKDAIDFWVLDEPPKECWTEINKDPLVFQWLECEDVDEYGLPKTLPPKG